MNHQDFTPIIWRKPHTKLKKQHKNCRTQQNITLDMDDGLYSNKKSSMSFQIALRKSREVQKLSQKQLALKLNVSVADLRSYESGTSIPSHNIRNRLNRLLTTTLPKP
jgi:ribosome-binding protein aMBF1 (putative translation factor)